LSLRNLEGDTPPEQVLKSPPTSTLRERSDIDPLRTLLPTAHGGSTAIIFGRAQKYRYATIHSVRVGSLSIDVSYQDDWRLVHKPDRQPTRRRLPRWYPAQLRPHRWAQLRP